MHKITIVVGVLLMVVIIMMMTKKCKRCQSCVCNCGCK